MNPLCPRVEITLGGEHYRLACTLLAWFRFEQRTAHPIYELRLELEEAITLVWAMLLTEHPQIEEVDVGAASHGEFHIAVNAAVTLLADMQPRPDEDAEPVPAELSKVEPINWRHVWGVARFNFRLSEDEFWSLAPWQLFELMKRHGADRDEYFLGHAMTCSAVTNCHIDSEKTEPFAPAAFMPGKIGERERKRREGDQKQTLKGKLGAFAKALGAKVTVTPLAKKK